MAFLCAQSWHNMRYIIYMTSKARNKPAGTMIMRWHHPLSAAVNFSNENRSRANLARTCQNF